MLIAHSPKYNADGTIDLTVKFPWLNEEVPFCASPSDSEIYGQELFAAAIAGDFGTVAPYIAPAAPPLTLKDFQKAHDAHINAPALARQYDSFATFALRAMRPGPWQTEAILFYDWMEACNVAGYAILAQVQAGTLPIPESTAAYIAMLPPLPAELV